MNANTSKIQVIGLFTLVVLFFNTANAQVGRLWATYYGGTDTEGTPGAKTATDALGNVYYCGTAESTDLPVSGGHQTTPAGGTDAFLVKFDANGNHLWSTYYGGTQDDWGLNVAVDGSGNVYLSGHSKSNTGIAVGGFQNAYTGGGVGDAFLVKFDASGVRQWGTYYGGASFEGGYGVATDNAGNVYMCGFTDATTSIASGGHQNTYGGSGDAYLVKFNASGARIWATYYGGSGSDVGRSVTTDASGNVFLAGETESATTTAIAQGGHQNTFGGTDDAFLVKFNSGGARLWGTYYGGTGDDKGYDVKTDASGNVYLCGYTKSTSAIATPSGFQNTYGGVNDGFLVKFNASGTRQWGTYYGGTAADGTNACCVDPAGNVFIAGGANSGTAIASSGGFQNAYGGSADAFLAKFTTGGARIAATYYGDTGGDEAFACATDPSGNVYISGKTSSTANVASGGFQNTYGGDLADGLLVKFAACTSAPSSAPGSITGSTTICQGSSNMYSIAPVPGALSYNWTLPGGWTGSSTTNSINVTASATGGTISVTANNGCANSAASDLAITVNPLPAAPGTISGTTTICAGSTNSYSITAVPGATSYTWSLPFGWSGTSTTTSISAVSDVSGGNVTVAANNGCGSSSASALAVTVNTIPDIPAIISGSTSVCAGSSNTYSIPPVPGATSYTWTLPGGWSGTSATETINTTAGASSGTITVTANNGCGSSSPRTSAITVNTSPATPGTISGTTNVCAGSSHTYSISPVAGAISYTWMLPSGWSGTSTTNSISAMTSATGGNIMVTANNSCGSSPASSLAIAVSASTPSTPGSIAGSATVCSGASQTYSVPSDPLATFYTWTLPGGWSGTSTSNSISASVGSADGTISVTASNVCGNSSASTLAIVVNTTPSAPGAVSGTSTICSGSSNTYSVAIVAGATSYTWTLPSGWSGSSATEAINTTSSSTSGNITVVANNGCGSSAASTLSVTVNITPSTPGAISGTASICSGSTNTYSVAAVGGATSYTWTLPSGWSGASSTNSISATADASSGTISAIANNACGSSSSSALVITVNTIPSAPGSIAGSTTICENSSNAYSIGAVTGADSYTWTLPSGWSGTSGTNSINATASATSGNITVTADNTCGSSPASTQAINVNPLPVVSYVQSPDVVCVNNSSVALSSATPAGGVYTGTAVTGSTFNATVAGLGTFAITYTYTDGNGCVNLATDNILVDPCLGLSTITAGSGISVYPNPAHDLITVYLKNMGQGQLNIFNAWGQMIFSSEMRSADTSIDVRHYPPGIYIIKIKTVNGTVSGKFIKE